SSLPVSFAPCWVHFPSERVNTHAEPEPSSGPPISAVLPSEETATLAPNWTALRAVAPVPVSFEPCWLHVSPERVNAHAAPTSLLSPGAPSSAVLAAPDEAEASATLAPNSPGCSSLLISSFSFFAFSGSASLACWVHISDELVNTHAAPVPL